MTRYVGASLFFLAVTALFGCEVATGEITETDANPHGCGNVYCSSDKECELSLGNTSDCRTVVCGDAGVCEVLFPSGTYCQAQAETCGSSSSLYGECNGHGACVGDWQADACGCSADCHVVCDQRECGAMHECVVPRCTSSNSCTYENAVAGTPCTVVDPVTGGQSAVPASCDGEGSCMISDGFCIVAEDCGMYDCKEWSCVDSVCAGSVAPPGTICLLAGGTTAGQCDANGTCLP